MKDIETSEKPIHKKVVIRLAMSLLLTGLAARWSIPYAFSMRGYFAIGGEYCLIMWMGTLPWLFPRHYTHAKGNLAYQVKGYGKRLVADLFHRTE